MEKIADVLEKKIELFNTVSPDSLVSDALYQMCSENVDHLIVVKDDKFVGLITDHDIAGRILFESRPLNRIGVREFMTANLPVVSPDNSLSYAMHMMERYRVPYVAVFDHFDFKAVLSSKELLQERIHEQHEPSVDHQAISWHY